jgi:hypothetical protein
VCPKNNKIITVNNAARLADTSLTQQAVGLLRFSFVAA